MLYSAEVNSWFYIQNLPLRKAQGPLNIDSESEY